MKRIIFTVATGPDKYAEMAMGLARSLHLIGDKTPRVVLTDNKNFPWSKYFDQVLEPVQNGESVFMAKYQALERTDADQVIFIDSDCLVFKKLEPIFEMCQGSGVAVQGRWASDGVWYERDLKEVCQELGVERIARLNSGVVFYERGPAYESVLRETRSFADQYRDLRFEVFRGKVPDEPCLSLAMAKTGVGKVLPLDLNLNESGVGLIGKLHLDVLTGTCKFVSGNPEVRLVEPYVFHAHYFSKLRVYWKELDKLKALEEHREKHGPRHMSRWLRLRRSFEKRFLKMTGKL